MKGKKQGLNGKSSLIMVKRLGKGVKPLDVRVAFENALELVEERLVAVVCEKAGGNRPGFSKRFGGNGLRDAAGFGD